MTYSPDFSVPSARRGLTSLFGMGRGGSPALLPPFLLRFASVGRLGSDGLVVAPRACTLRVNSDGSVACVRFVLRFCALRLVLFCLCRPFGGKGLARKALGLLVLLGFAIADFTPAAYRRCRLQRPSGRSYLEVGFALRCFQRLSVPDAVTRPCTWRYNRFAVGRSNTVLSY